MLSPSDRQEATRVAREAARAASHIVRAGLPRHAPCEPDAPDIGIEYKGAVDLVTRIDRESEACILEHLGATGWPILAEESGGQPVEDGPLWVVDPVDGTTNLAHGIPHVGISIGLWNGQRAELGVVANAATGEVFWNDSESVFVDEQRLRPVPERPLEQALLATGFPYDRRDTHRNNCPQVTALLPKARCIRRFGAASLDLAWVAAGRLQGFWEPGLKPWDIVGGLALCEAAGCTVTDLDGQPWRFGARWIVVGPPGLHAELLAALQESVRATP